MENVNKEFLENLNKLSKKELIDFVYNYWNELQTEADNKVNNKKAYMSEESGRILMTQAIRMRNILSTIVNKTRIEIDSKIFVCKYHSDNELIIPVNNKEERVFFEKWIKIKEIHHKEDYVKDARIFETYQTGVLKNCFPNWIKNKNEVKIIYDFYGDKTLKCDM